LNNWRNKHDARHSHSRADEQDMEPSSQAGEKDTKSFEGQQSSGTTIKTGDKQASFDK